jgi:hypothetical protein
LYTSNAGTPSQVGDGFALAGAAFLVSPLSAQPAAAHAESFLTVAGIPVNRPDMDGPFSLDEPSAPPSDG